MITKSRSNYLRGWLVRSGAALLLVAFCNSAIADPSKNVVASTKQTARVTKKHRKCYTWVTGFGMPIPCEQMQGAVSTTSHPMITIGNQTSIAE